MNTDQRKFILSLQSLNSLKITKLKDISPYIEEGIKGEKKMAKTVVLGVLVLLVICSLYGQAGAGSLVKFLPGFQGPLPFPLETGSLPIFSLLHRRSNILFFFFFTILYYNKKVLHVSRLRDYLDTRPIVLKLSYL